MAEKEYIERGAVLQHKRKMSGADWGGEFWDEAVLCEEIRKIPAADVVEVVRCKDCVHYKQNQYSTDEYMMCKRWCDWLPTDPDDFCSYGERKEQK